MKKIIIYFVCLLIHSAGNLVFSQDTALKADFRYAPTEWQTSICLVDD